MTAASAVCRECSDAIGQTVREDARTKAARLAASGRLDIRRVDEDAVEAVVRGDSAAEYLVTWHRGRGWSCTCPAWSYRCSHTLALMLCTIRPNEEGNRQDRP